MAEKMSEVYEMYDMKFEYAGRGRGAALLRTDKGMRQIRPVSGGEARLLAEYEFKERMYEAGFPHIDRIVKNSEGELITCDRYGNPFVMRMYFDGREMNVTNKGEIAFALDNLAALHRAGRTVFLQMDRDMLIREKNDVRRRNREMKRVYHYVSRQSPKREFESLYMKAFPYFYEQGLACETQEQTETETVCTEHVGYCHGSYNHHSVLICGANPERYAATVNFDRYYVGNQLQDLYYFIRKTVEKNGYNFPVLVSMLERYRGQSELTRADLWYIYRQYQYPEKFYKLSNQYINGSKTRISPKMTEKINRITEDEDKKQDLIRRLREFIISKN